ncbi:broad specificity 5'(3')-nucleotidase and polyphosphatase [Campylobacter pinnipediorum subsp. caledonicus]|uniref:5'-nucleotidase SurE n=1 Tax=Campylobacter pinnipediorum subsp. caledonicus TaxID=1874362 RepID=A0A1S6U9H6_9BACT|nr:5'/3'-nucleotidase SurE [Campylobacter pinnipediorum]AQW88322.1 broad specificity 5'(3')-nucleotidase and polyphosphatase [Campylobacter pinnipediorum subsp. caledonicus]OPA70539.1 5'/3'-nucleotidase SurE [Campylobacter pinnipediorum subsp. caledonicus]
MKEILITNDDGYEANGLIELRNALLELGDVRVTVVAPSSEKSACAHSLTLTKPLRFIKIDDDFFKLEDATPSDCVYLSFHALFNKKPDLVISGINHGSNLGEDITYSGTCGACMESILQDVPSIAFSQFYKNNSLSELGFDLAKDVVKYITKKVLNGDVCLPKRQFLNVNIPSVKRSDFKGYKVVPIGNRKYGTDAMLNRNPRGVEYYWLGNLKPDFTQINEENDLSEINAGYATITPIKVDLTAYESIDSLKKVF